jgi:L-iditol 2-dehydrogenase
MWSVTYTTLSSSSKMPVAVLVEPGRIQMEQRPIPPPAAGDVLVRVSAVSVCGSDTHYYRHGRVGGFALDSDRVPGTVKLVVTVS